MEKIAENYAEYVNGVNTTYNHLAWTPYYALINNMPMGVPAVNAQYTATQIFLPSEGIKE